MLNRLPNVKKPCKDCPMTKQCTRNWLGRERIEEIVNQHSFVCHKNTKLQCAGHMILLKHDNTFYRTAYRMGLDLHLSGFDLVFDSKQDCIEHHSGE